MIVLLVYFQAIPSHLPRILNFESKWLPSSPYWNILTQATELSAQTQVGKSIRIITSHIY